MRVAACCGQKLREPARGIPVSHRWRESFTPPAGGDDFASALMEQLRDLRLVAVPAPAGGVISYEYRVEVWRQEESAAGRGNPRKKMKWVLFESRVPLRLGKPLPVIPFVFHGTRHSLPEVDRIPLSDLMFLNLDHYRLDADFKHGLHYTALPRPGSRVSKNPER